MDSLHYNDSLGRFRVYLICLIINQIHEIFKLFIQFNRGVWASGLTLWVKCLKMSSRSIIVQKIVLDQSLRINNLNFL